jgi:hypothetical protein
MKIYNLEVTSNFFDKIDDGACHIELDGCIRYVYLIDTEYNNMLDLEEAITNLIITNGE